MPITEEDLKNWFTYHEPIGNDPDSSTWRPDEARIRTAALLFATVILECTPPSADQTAAIRKIREAVFTANASIACGGK